MALFHDLHAAGMTVILITHDAGRRRRRLAAGPRARRQAPPVNLLELVRLALVAARLRAACGRS